MDPERRLLALYVSGFVCAAISTTSLSVIWLYWDPTLNSCLHVNCGCILYSMVTFNMFVGGAAWFCRFTVFVQLPVLLWATVAALYHAYRIYVPKRPPVVRRRTVTFNEDGTRRAASVKRDPPHYSVFAVLAGMIAVALLTQTWIVCSGYFTTCREYRKSVSDQLQANGNMAQLVFERLSCSTVYDFLDYLQPDPETLPDRLRRTYRVTTANYMQVALVSSCLDTAVWVTIAVYNIYLTFHSPAKT